MQGNSFRGSGTYNKEVGKGGGDAAEGAPEEEDLCTKVCITMVGTNQIRSYDGNDLSYLVSIVTKV